MQSTFKKLRENIIFFLFEWSQPLYVKYFKRSKQPWAIDKQKLRSFPKDTLGLGYVQFLDKNGFDILTKLEKHDAYHVLTGCQTTIKDEIALQYMLFGNGKWSIYNSGVLLVGTLLLPEYFSYYCDYYKCGKSSNRFYDLDYENLLSENIHDLRESIFSSTYSLKLNIN